MLSAPPHPAGDKISRDCPPEGTVPPPTGEIGTQPGHCGHARGVLVRAGGFPRARGGRGGVCVDGGTRGQSSSWSSCEGGVRHAAGVTSSIRYSQRLGSVVAVTAVSVPQDSFTCAGAQWGGQGQPPHLGDTGHPKGTGTPPPGLGERGAPRDKDTLGGWGHLKGTWGTLGDGGTRGGRRGCGNTPGDMGTASPW